MGKKILLFTTEMLPGLGYPIGGGGIRAWQIGEGLRSRGHAVIYSLPRKIVEGKDDLPASLKEFTHYEEQLDDVIESVKPDVVVCIQWHHVNKIKKELQIPLAIDLFGLLMLENAYFDQFNIELFSISKIEAIAKADYFICATEKQKAYFMTWMVMAGIHPKEECIEAIPVSLSPELPEYTIPEEPVFVFGGVFWPWQDPFTPLNEVIKTLDTEKKGQIKIFGSVHPYLKEVPFTYGNPDERLIKSERVQRFAMLQHEEMMAEYAKTSIAADLMMPNNERFLAYPIRTVCYLWCGLPLIIPNFNDASQLVKEYQAGWVVDTTKPGEVAATVKYILEHPEIIPQYKANAQKLVREKLTWDITIEPLHRFCENPRKLAKQDNMFKQISLSLYEANQKLGAMAKDIEYKDRELELLRPAKADLDAIRGKTLYKFYHKLKSTLKGS
jgi:glycosyltransferase involved in cell wall biosynthesis